MRTPKSDWTDLFLAFQMCLDPRKLWLAFRGVILSIVLLGLLLAGLAAVQRARGIGYLVATVADASGRPVREIWKRQLLPSQPLPERYRLADTDVLGDLKRGRLGDAARATRNFVVGTVRSAASDVDDWITRRVPMRYALVHVVWLSEALSEALLVAAACGLILLLIWSYYGGAIMRVTAVEYALGERIELTSAVAYTRRKHHCFYGPPLALVAAILLLWTGIVLVGLIAWNVLALIAVFGGLLAAGVVGSVARDRTRSLAAGLGAGIAVIVLACLFAWLIVAQGWRIPVLGELIALVLAPLIFLAGLLVALLGIWIVFGLPLMAGTIANRDGDLFDAWSCSFHYLFVHPWRYACYALVALAYGVPCLAFVYGVRSATEWATLLPFSVGLVGQFEGVYDFLVADPTLVGATAGEGILAFALAFGRFILDVVFLSFVAVYACVAAAIAYGLLRLRSDGTPISEVHLEPRDQELLQPPPAAPAGTTP